METEKKSGLVFGAILIGVGALLLLGQFFDLGANGLWPFIIIGIGAMFFVAMILTGKGAGGLAIPGSIISMVGLILLVQNLFNLWETWSYAWALIIVAVGIGQYLHGVWSNLPQERKNGLGTIGTGLTLFLVFATIMEIIFGLTGVGTRLGSMWWALLIVAAGLLQLIWRIIRVLRKPADMRTDDADLFGPVLLTGIGGLLVLYASKVVPGDQILRLVSLWPLLLVALGIQIIFGRRKAWVSLVLGLLLVGSLFGVALYGPQLGIALPEPWKMFDNIEIGNGPITERVTGNGEAQTVIREVKNFNTVDLEGLGKLEIIQGSNEQLRITADSNLMPYLTSTISGNVLALGVKRGVSITPKEPIMYQLTVKDLQKIEISGAGDVTIGSFEADNFEIDSPGAGKLVIDNLSATEVEIHLSGAGSIELGGKADSVDISISGAGNLKADDFEVDEATIRISGLGSTSLRVNQSLKVEISGAGSVSYYGTPSVRQDITGLGKVNKLGD